MTELATLAVVTGTSVFAGSALLAYALARAGARGSALQSELFTRELGRRRQQAREQSDPSPTPPVARAA